MEKTLREKARDFIESAEFGELKRHWTFRCEDSFVHARVLNINIEWIVRRWENCEETEIYKTLISKARQKLYTIMSEEDEEYVKQILEYNKRRLYEKLTCDIYEYCIR